METSPESTTALPWPVDEESRSKLVDSFLISGVFGHDSAAIQTIDQLKAVKDDLLAHEKQLLDADIDLLNTDLENARSTQRSAEFEADQLKSEAATIRSRILAGGQELTNLLSERANLLRSLLSKRLSYPVRLLQKKQETMGELARIVASLSVEEENQRLEYERALHKLANERRDINKDEYDRRVASLAEQRRVSEGQFSKLDQYIENLRFLGLTRTTAGFMVWAGYISFTAFGWFAGDIVQQILGAGREALPIFQQLVEMLASALQAAIAQLGLLLTTVLVLIGPLVPIAIIGGLFWLADKIMSGFDAQWFGKKNSKKKEKEGRNEFSPWPQMTKISRGDYTQAIGRLPFLYVWMLVPLLIAFIFTFSGESASGGRLPSPSVPGLLEPVDSFVFAFLGVVLCIMIASFSLLYATRIIEPRFKRLLAASGPIGLREAVRVNFELVVLLGLFLVLVIGANLLGIVLPAAVPSQTWAAAGLWVMLLLNGMTVSYGLIYRGQFRDHAALRRVIDAYGDEMERYSAFPVVEVGQEDVDRYQDRLTALRKEIEEVWRTEDFFEDPLGRGPSRFRRWLNRRRSIPDGNETLVTMINADEFLEPHLIEEIGKITRQVDKLRAESGVHESRQREIAARLEELKNEIAGDAVRILHSRKRSREQQYQARVADISLSFFSLVSRCQGAMKMGSSLRQEINPSRGD